MLKVNKCMGAILCVTLFGAYLPVIAQERNGQKTQSVQLTVAPFYSLQDAVNLTLKQHLELKPFAIRESVNQGLIQQAATATPYNIDVSITDALGSGDYNGLDAMQTELGISWLLEQSQVDARVDVAKAQAQTNQLEQKIKALDLAASTASTFVVLLSQQQQLKLAKLTQHQAEKMLADIRIRVKAGQLAKIDEYRAIADLEKKALVVEDLHHEIEASKSLIAAQWQGNGDFIAKGSLQNVPKINELEALERQLLNNPRLKLFATKERISQSQVNLAKVDNKPAWKVSAGLKHNQALNDVALSAGVSIPFTTSNRNLGKIQALQAQQLEYQAQADAWRSKVSTQLLLLTHKLKHNAHVVEGLNNNIIPALQIASEQAESAFIQGNYRYSDWYDIQQELNTAKVELIEAYSNIHLFNIELQRLTGLSVSTGI